MTDFNALGSFCQGIEKSLVAKDKDGLVKSLADIEVLVQLLASKKSKVTVALKEIELEATAVHWNATGLELDQPHDVVFEYMMNYGSSYTLYFIGNGKSFYMGRPKKNLEGQQNLAGLRANQHLLRWCGLEYRYGPKEIYQVMDLLCGRILNKKVTIQVLKGENLGLNCRFIGNWV